MSNANKIVSIAKAEKGYHEGRSGGSWNNNQKYSDQVPGLEWSDYQAWCCTFVAWCAMKASAATLYPKTASCLNAVHWFKNKGQWSEYPAIGAQVFFGSGGGSHTGLVYNYDSTYIYTVEGNTNNNGSAEGDGVYEKKRSRRDSYVYGYGYPTFTEGLKSADPSYKGKTPPKAPSKPATPKVARYKVVINGKEYGYGAKGSQVTEVGKALVAKGFGKYYKEGPGPSWSDADTQCYQLFQKSLGYTGKDADGVPGEGSLKKLLAKPAAKPSASLKAVVYGATHPKSAEQSHPSYAASTKLVQKALGLKADGVFGVTTKSAYAKFQRSLGYSGHDADGVPGMVSLKQLGSKHGFTVKP